MSELPSEVLDATSFRIADRYYGQLRDLFAVGQPTVWLCTNIHRHGHATPHEAQLCALRERSRRVNEGEGRNE